MKDEIRPNPDQLLETFKRREKKKRGGRLYLFLGMAPGVGKTYAMILSAQEAKKSGIDVVVGVVESHGRKDTEALLDGLTFLPKMQVEYRDKKLFEMDLNGILSRKPTLVLVDELAHTNIPGSRHAKRWQDVYEILDAGIDVFSTLNVQHVESRKEIVEQIAGIRVNETVPDSVIDRAHQIRLIDLAPQDLLRRLKEGKVYLGEQAGLAAENFFKEDRLTALREISLRLTAEKVDSDLQSYSADRGADETWAVSERLLVLIEPSTSSEALIRATRKLAFNLEAPWIAAYIDTAQVLSDEQKACVAKNLQMARSLGAEIATLTDTDVAAALRRLAVQKNVTQIVLGRKSGTNPFAYFARTSLLEKLLKKTDIALHIIQERPSSPNKVIGRFGDFFRPEAGISSYFKAGLFILSLTLFNSILAPLMGYRAVGFVFLLGTLLFSLLFSFGPILFMSSVTALIWGIFFIPPAGEWQVHNPEDVFMVATYLVAALAMGILTQRSLKHQSILVKREARSQILYEMSQEIATNMRKEEMIAAVGKKMGEFLGAQCDVLISRKDGSLKSIGLERLQMSKIDKEIIVAQWVFDNKKPAGWSTNTLAGSEALYIPLVGSSEKIGVLVFKPGKATSISPADQDLLFSVARQLAVSLEKEIFREKLMHTERLQDLDKMHRTTLSLMAEEVRETLSFMGENLDSLNQSETKDLYAAIDKLTFSIDNLLVLSRIAVGINPLQKSKVSLRNLLEVVELSCTRLLKNHRVALDLDGDVELCVEVELMKKALANIFLNVAELSPKESAIDVRIIKSAKLIRITVLDQGSEEGFGKIFEKFSLATNRDQRSIGFAVAKGIIKAHGGKISTTQHDTATAINISLPMDQTEH
jgi:two-component system sensor histidine kinase KdpD